MSDGDVADSDERPTVGVVAPATDAGSVVEAVADAGAVADTAAVADVAAVVAVGDGALSSLAATDVSTPVLPVEASADGVSRETVRSALERVLAGTHDIRRRPFVRVETPADSGHALFDVSLVAAEPATISEFAVSATGSSTPLARFRADGVVVATPAGSRDYARAAGGPVVVPGSNVATVVPIAPFATDPDHWVLPLSGVALTVERDEVDVELSLDGRSFCTVAPGSTVRLAREGSLPIAIVPESGRE